MIKALHIHTKCINHVSSSFLFVLIKFEVMYVEYWEELSEATAHSSACCCNLFMMSKCMFLERRMILEVENFTRRCYLL